MSCARVSSAGASLLLDKRHSRSGRRRTSSASRLRRFAMPRFPRIAGALLLVFTLATTALAGCAAPWPFPQPTPDPKLPDSQQIFHPQMIGPASGDLETLDPALIEFNSDYDIA